MKYTLNYEPVPVPTQCMVCMTSPAFGKFYYKHSKLGLPRCLECHQKVLDHVKRYPR